jgi:hypothetical protein
MTTNTIDILSHFIKDPIERAKCIIKKKKYEIRIEKENKLLYSNRFYMRKRQIVNYILNIYNCEGITCSNKIYSNKIDKFKQLFYKKDRRLNCAIGNFITYKFNYNKYFNKTRLQYFIDIKILLITYIIYYNKYKYIYIDHKSPIKLKYINSLLLIINKYELHYYNRFFTLYFDDYLGLFGIIWNE